VIVSNKSEIYIQCEKPMGKEIDVEVIGVNPPCMRCEATWKGVEKAASILRSEDVNVSVSRIARWRSFSLT